MPLLIGLITFAAVGLLVSYLVQPRTDDIRRRILAGAEETVDGPSTDRRPGDRLLRPTIHAFGSALSKLLPQNLAHNIETTLIRAGEPMSLASFMTIWLSIAILSVAIVAWLISANPGWGFTRHLLLGGMIMCYGSATPLILLKRRAAKRRKAIERALPDALDLLLTSIEAGLGVDAAFAMVAQKTKGPLADKLNEYLRRVGLGQSRGEALDEIAQRSGAAGLTRLATVVNQATAVGTTMGDVLRIQAAELRTARRLKAQEAAAKAPIWMTIPLALCFMPAMGAVIVVPSIIHLLESISELGLRQ